MSLPEVLQAHYSTQASPLNLARPGVPAELAALVAKMMAKEPEHRFQTPAEVAKALTPFCKQQTKEAGDVRVESGSVSQSAEANRAPATAAVAPEPIASTEADTWASLIEIDETDDDWDDASSEVGASAARWRARRLAVVGLAILTAVVVGIAVMLAFNLIETKPAAERREDSAGDASPAGSSARRDSRAERGEQNAADDSKTSWRTELDMVEKAIAPWSRCTGQPGRDKVHRPCNGAARASRSAALLHHVPAMALGIHQFITPAAPKGVLELGHNAGAVRHRTLVVCVDPINEKLNHRRGLGGLYRAVLCVGRACPANHHAVLTTAQPHRDAAVGVVEPSGLVEPQGAAQESKCRPLVGVEKTELHPLGSGHGVANVRQRLHEVPAVALTIDGSIPAQAPGRVFKRCDNGRSSGRRAARMRVDIVDDHIHLARGLAGCKWAPEIVCVGAGRADHEQILAECQPCHQAFARAFFPCLFLQVERRRQEDQGWCRIVVGQPGLATGNGANTR